MITNAVDPDIKDPPKDSLVLRRLAECRRIINLTSTIGAGLLAEVAVFTTLETDTPNAGVSAFWFVVTFFLAGLGAVWARGASEFQANIIESLLERKIIHETMPIDEIKKLSKNTITSEVSLETKLSYFLSIVFALLSAALLIFQAWFSFMASTELIL